MTTRHRAGVRQRTALPVTGSKALLTCLLALAVTALVAAPEAWATVRPFVEVRLGNPPHAAQAGQQFQDVLVITPTYESTITGLRVEGDGWSVAPLQIAALGKIGARQNVRVPFSATPSDPAMPLTVTFEVDGMPYQAHLDVSAHAYEVAQGPMPTQRIPDAQVTPFPGIDNTLARPAPLPPVQRPLSPQAEELQKSGGNPGQAQPAANRNIRVHGRFVYQRWDGQTIGADGVTAHIYDQNSVVDYGLADVATDAFGYYDVTFFWSGCFLWCGSEPDIYIVFDCANTKVEITNTGGSRYSWRTGTVGNYTGTDLDFGWLEPGNPADFPSLHLLTDLTRTWRWLQNRGYDCPGLRGYWPDGTDGAYYNGSIHMSSGEQWNENTQSHEYGHHFIYNFATGQTPDYCNSICDTPPPCGHCLWCRETDHDAWNEGAPDWLGDIIPRSYAGTYGLAATAIYNFESVATCGGALDDVQRTEGFIAAALRDIEDSTNDNDPSFAAGIDQLSVGPGPILTTIDLDNPLNPYDFLNKFKARYPGWCEPLWQTAKNNGYELDGAPPSAVTGLTSPSHAPFTSSPDPTVDFTWARALDDCSGTAGYSIVIASGFVFPDAIAELGNVTSYTTGILSPGTYYFNIRSVDYAGRWSATYAAYGPFTIRAPEPANLVYALRAGWAHPVVPRGAADANLNSVPAPVTLPGNAASTYMNIYGINNGESATSTGFWGELRVDNEHQLWVSWGSIGASGAYYAPNWGPSTVRGGRHTYEFIHDAVDNIAETNEFDNRWARQWIWTPLNIADGVEVVRTAPPSRYGGTGSIVDGSGYYVNCDGLRASPNLWWTAVYGYALNLGEDYDLTLHNPSSGAYDGFASSLAYSGRLEGCLDAVFVNRNTTAYQQYDVGVVNYDLFHLGTSNYRAMQATNSYLAFQDSIPVSFGAGEMLKMWECFIPVANVGPVSVTVDLADPSQGPVHVNWLDRTFTQGSLFTYSYTSVTDATTGRARLDMNIGSSGYYGLVVYRDPKDGTAPINVTIEESTTPPDYTPYLAAGWYAPLVPRPANDGTPGSAPAPAVLWGDVASTYFNYGFANISPTGDPFLHTLTYLDGTAYWYFDSWPYGPYTSAVWNWNAAWTIGGGRHTLSVHLDPDNSVEEIYENNNINGQQWVWQPSALALATPVSRNNPPDRLGGLTDVTTGEPYYVNCDGLRTPLFSPGTGYWGGVAVMPGPTSDVDVRYHEVAPNAKTGFDIVLASSTWGTAASDYVVANFNRTAFRRLDAGIVNWASAQGYTAEAVTSLYLGGTPVSYGPVLLGPGHIMHLYEVFLAVGTYNVRLENLSGSVDWGLTMHDQAAVYDNRSGSVTNGTSFLNGPGFNEWVTVNITTAGFYGVGVWKTSSADLTKSGTYRLSILQPATDVASSPNLPNVTALSDVHPNPFNPRTAVSFDLAREGDVRVVVYDAAGRMVRTLVSETRPAGRYEITWDGHDDAGQQVASGVYIVRLESASASDQRKITLVK
jgi:hypothetical protein